MNQIKTLHQEASDVLWEIGVKRILIRGKKESIANMKRSDIYSKDELITLWSGQLGKLYSEKAEFIVKYKDQLNELLTLTDKL